MTGLQVNGDLCPIVPLFRSLTVSGVAAAVRAATSHSQISDPQELQTAVVPGCYMGGRLLHSHR